MDFAEMSSKFQEEFGKAADRKYFAPGRINIIGEHIDYNGGLVFPSPITLGTYALVGKREDKLVRAYSINFEEIGIIEFSLDNLEYNKEHNWVNYLKGVAKALIEEDYALQHGFDIVVYGNIPNGSGLSSSASLEMLSVTIFKDLFELPITPVEAALLGKKVENQYIGVNSGIMDQFAIALGKKDHVILLDCNTLEYSYHPLQLEKHSIVIMNTNKRRELADSKYNERRSECESALEKLQTVCTANNLCEITLEELEANKELLTEVEYRRVHHVITENARVKQATTALAEGDLVQLGQLLNGSHTSLCKDYEVTGIELDTLAEAAWQAEGVLGARMTGAGFGGCGIALVENESVDNFIEQVGKKYKEVIGYEASFFVANIGDGPIRVD
ncbi:galactokinase [Niameybacter massiliensis]|uniref:Galactokinase n=1 Tax=Holtiella tumoricola TaxID=3018743 RepID=A0AA42IYD8_9FIRM|nr:galactokinase [Holtiella tumoricola]